MTRTPRLGLGLFIILNALTTSGCAALATFEQHLAAAGIARFQHPPEPGHGRAVTLIHRQGGRRVHGRGAVVGRDLVMTVEHVVGEADQVFVATSSNGRRGWIRASVVARTENSPERLVLLRLETAESWLGSLLYFEGFDRDEAFDTALAQDPAYLHTQHGVDEFHGAEPIPGDSGSPVTNARGELVGLFTGRMRLAGTPVYTPLSPLVLARLWRAKGLGLPDLTLLTRQRRALD